MYGDGLINVHIHLAAGAAAVAPNAVVAPNDVVAPNVVVVDDAAIPVLQDEPLPVVNISELGDYVGNSAIIGRVVALSGVRQYIK